MSFQALNWAVRQRVGTPVGKGILMALANYADEKGTCFPSHERIARETELSDKSVRVHMKRFEDLKIITAKRDRDDGQRHVIIRYTLALDREFEIEPEEVRGKRKKKLLADQNANEETTSEGLPVAGTAGLPPASGAEKPPVSDATVTLSKNNPLSLPSQPSGEVDSREDQNPGLKEPDAREIAFQKFLRPPAMGGYPPAAIDDVDKARAAWAKVDEEDWGNVFDAVPRYVLARKAIRRDTLASLERFIRQEIWKHHPPPANAGVAVQAVELKPYVKELWAMYWKAIHRVRHATGDDRHIRRLRDCTGWLVDGVTTGAVSLPSADDLASLVPIKIDGPEHLAWQDYTTRIGARLPRPDHVPVIYAPAAWPPPLTLAGSKPYRLALPVRIEVRSPAWWWRFFKSIEDGTPIISTLAGRHRVDLLEPARRSAGAQEVDYGPIPLPSEISAMVEVKTLTDAFEQWSTWIAARGGDLAMWPHGSIWAPSEYPTMIFGQGKQEEGAAA